MSILIELLKKCFKKKEIDEYHKKLDSEPSHIEELKRMLNEITEILSMSMIMEFKISDVTEKFRTLKQYE